MKTSIVLFIHAFLLIFIHDSVLSQVPSPPSDVASCGNDCQCLNKLISSDTTTIDTKAHAHYYHAFNCDTIKVDKFLRSFKKAISLWDLYDYKEHRKHNAYRILLEHYMEKAFSIDSLNHYFKLAKEASITGNSIAARNLAECYNYMGRGYGEVQDYYSQVDLFSELINSRVYSDLADSAKVMSLYYGVEGFLDFPTAAYVDTIKTWLDYSYELLSSKPFVSLHHHNLYLSLNKYNEGRLYEKLGDFQYAIRLFIESRSFARNINYLRYEAIASTAIAENNFKIKEYDNSIKEGNVALKLFKSDSLRHNENCETYYWLAKSNRELDNYDKVEELIFEGINLSFDTTAISQENIKNLDIKTSKNGEYTLRLLLELADFKFDEYKISKNVYLLEKAKEYYNLCFVFFHEFVSQQGNFNSRYLNKEIQIELFDNLIEIGLLFGDSQSLFNTVDRNKMSIMEQSDFTRQSKITDFQTECTIIQYAFTSDSLLAIVFDNKTFTTYRLGESKMILDLIRTYTIQLSDIDDDIYMTSHRLYKALIEPLNLDVEQLIIIPDNELYYIPFGALNQSLEISDSYLEEKYDIHYQYSASLIREAMPINLEKGGLSIFIPEFNERLDRIYATIRSATSEMDLFHLPYAMSEGKYLENEFNGQLSAVNKKSIISSLENDRIVHYAGHAVTLPGNPDFSFLALSSEVSEDENKFYMKELLDLTCNNDMVVLSACETGTGKIAKGEGALSLARGFFFAGAKSVISTLWSVNDQSSSMIMKSFYSNLKAGQPKDVALSNAKLSYLANMKDPNYRHPFYWAGFIPVGDMSPLRENPSKNKRLLFGGVLISLLMTLFIFRNRLFQLAH